MEMQILSGIPWRLEVSGLSITLSGTTTTTESIPSYFLTILLTVEEFEILFPPKIGYTSRIVATKVSTFLK